MQPDRAPRRIGLFLGVDPSAGGMFQYAQSLLKAFASYPTQEYEIKVACVGSEWRRVLAGYPFSVTSLRFGTWGLQLANVLMAAQVPGALSRAVSGFFNPIAWQLKRMKCDLWIFPAQDAITYQLRLPSLGTVHDLMHRYEPSFPEVARGRRYQIREHRFRNIVSWARGILVDSEMGKTHVVESYAASPDKIHSLPYVVPFHAPREVASADFDSRYGLPHKFFLYPAQFWAHKNHAALIGALVAARSKCPDIQLVLAGGQNHEFAKVRAQVVALGLQEHITFVGYVPEADLQECYRRARALVMPTFFGPTNIPPLEAFSCGCPVAVSRIYGMPEQLGEAALYFDPRSIDEMAAVLERLWLDGALCGELREKGRQKLASWGPPQFAARLRSIIESIPAG